MVCTCGHVAGAHWSDGCCVSICECKWNGQGGAMLVVKNDGVCAKHQEKAISVCHSCIVEGGFGMGYERERDALRARVAELEGEYVILGVNAKRINDACIAYRARVAALETALREIAGDHEPESLWCTKCGNKPINCTVMIARAALADRDCNCDPYRDGTARPHAHAPTCPIVGGRKP